MDIVEKYVSCSACQSGGYLKLIGDFWYELHPSICSAGVLPAAEPLGGVEEPVAVVEEVHEARVAKTTAPIASFEILVIALELTPQ